MCCVMFDIRVNVNDVVVNAGVTIVYRVHCFSAGTGKGFSDFIDLAHLYVCKCMFLAAAT